jgi:hypothetical protein
MESVTERLDLEKKASQRSKWKFLQLGKIAGKLESKEF